MSRMKFISWVLGTLISVTVVIGIVAKVDQRYTCEALASAVNEDLKEHKIEVRMKHLQERMWTMEDRWGERYKENQGRIHHTMHELVMFMTAEARETYRELEAEYEALEAELEPKEKADDDG